METTPSLAMRGLRDLLLRGRGGKGEEEGRKGKGRREEGKRGRGGDAPPYRKFLDPPLLLKLLYLFQ